MTCLNRRLGLSPSVWPMARPSLTPPANEWCVPTSRAAHGRRTKSLTRWHRHYLRAKTCARELPVCSSTARVAFVTKSSFAGASSHEEDIMQDESTLIHREHVSDRPFDAVVAAFDAAVGT